MKRTFILAVVILLLAACAKTPTTSEDNEKLKVVATSFPVYEFAREIGKDLIDVTLLTKSSSDAHSFDPTPQDLVAMNQTDLLVYTNDAMEPWIDRIKSSLESKVTLLNSSKEIKLSEHHHEHEEHDEHDEHDGHDHSSGDPHTWVSMKNAKKMVKSIYEAMIEIKPELKTKLESNYQAYLEKLEKLDAEYEAVFDRAKQKTVVFLGHFAFNYLFEDFHFDYKVLYESLSHETELTAAKIKEIIDVVKEHQLSYVFKEELASDKVVDTILANTNTKALELHGAHQLSKEDQAAKTSFIEIQERNIENLKKGLQ